MTDGPVIRATCADDVPALAALYSAAFPNEDLVPLVRRLLGEVPDILSLAASSRDGLSGHVVCTPCGVGETRGCVALLGPLAVTPAQQRRGIGGALIRDALRRMRSTGLMRMLVLGDPRYYRRFGFSPEQSIRPPYPLPAQWSDAWQSLTLGNDNAPVWGVLRPPAAWMLPDLWAP